LTWGFDYALKLKGSYLPVCLPISRHPYTPSGLLAN
jgi:hypothetical protein